MCHGAGPGGEEAAAIHAAAFGYIVEYRTRFFPSAIDQVCLDGPDAARVASRMRHEYLPVRAGCAYLSPGYARSESRSQDSVPVVSLAKSDSAANWYDFLRGAGFSSGMGWLTTRHATNSAKIYRGLMSTCAVAAMAIGCVWFAGWSW